MRACWLTLGPRRRWSVTARRDVEWDALDHQRPDALVDSKRNLEALDQQRVGWEPDWKLRLVMLREQREEEEHERRVAYSNQPWVREKRSAVMKSAWARGAFAERKRGYAKRTDAKVAIANAMKSNGHTYAEIASALDVTPYTVGKWLGWERKPEATNRKPITIEGVTYPSQRAAERATGIPRFKMARKVVE
jgi:hypothetical protein